MSIDKIPDMVDEHFLLDAIESFSITARGLQTQIGVSEVGMACQRCVIRKLAGVEKEQFTGSWRAQLGTYVHAGLADEFESRWGGSGVIIERSLIVHEYKGFVLKGSCDAFFPNGGKGFVVDWKIVGDATLDSMKKGSLKNQYFVQGQLYALGWELAGYPVERIAVMFLPANKGNLKRDAVPHVFDYDKSVAVRSLAKLEAYIDMASEVGWETLLRQHQPGMGCFSCKQYEKADNPVNDLLLR
jgi:hypothetical protein